VDRPWPQHREIGEALGISEATVKWHVSIILSRSTSTTRTQAAVVALQRGIVHLPGRADEKGLMMSRMAAGRIAAPPLIDGMMTASAPLAPQPHRRFGPL